MISDLEARRIASGWHGGGGSPSYQFLSVGRITPQLKEELEDAMSDIHFNAQRGNFPPTHEVIIDVIELARLIDYVSFHGVRDFAFGWSGLTW